MLTYVHTDILAYRYTYMHNMYTNVHMYVAMYVLTYTMYTYIHAFLLNGDCNFAALNNESNAKACNNFKNKQKKSGGSGIRPWGNS